MENEEFVTKSVLQRVVFCSRLGGWLRGNLRLSGTPAGAGAAPTRHLAWISRDSKSTGSRRGPSVCASRCSHCPPSRQGTSGCRWSVWPLRRHPQTGQSSLLTQNYYWPSSFIGNFTAHCFDVLILHDFFVEIVSDCCGFHPDNTLVCVRWFRYDVIVVWLHSGGVTLPMGTLYHILTSQILQYGRV